MANRLCQFVQMGHANQLTKPIFDSGESIWWYEVRSVDILSATTTTTTTTTTKMKTIESLKTEQITPVRMTGEGTEDGVEAVALSAPSLRGHAQRSWKMGIIGRDRQEFRLQGEGGICPHGSGGGRPPNMVGRPCAGAWRTGPQTQYFTTPRGEPLIKFGSPGMMPI